MSTDNSVEVIKRHIQGDERFILIQNKNKQYALGNIVNTLLKYCKDDEDVNILLDGDDWFPSRSTLYYLHETYAESKCLLTYGNYIYFPNGSKGLEPSEYPFEVIESNSFRKDQWRASHLRTFKTKLWKHLDLNDLRQDKQQYYQTAYDQALMLPLLELAGHRSKFIDKIMHVYNRSNPLNVDKVKQQLQYNTALSIRSKKPYKRKF